MSRRLALLSTAAVLLAGAPFLGTASAAAPAPQVTDIANDANFLNGDGRDSTGPLAGNNATPVGSQAYADVLSVLWAPKTVTTGKGKKAKTTFVGFTVKATFSAAPVPPAGTTLVYRMLSHVKGASYLGPIFYTAKMGTTPQSALRDNIGPGAVTRLTPIDLPVISGSTMTWTVPAKALPKEFELGTSVTNLYFEVRELESFGGQTLPAGLPLVGGASGLAEGLLDDGTSTSSFKIG